MNLTLKILLIVIAIIVVIALALPSILNLAGLHPKFDGNSFNLKGKKALIIATNHGILNKPGETDGKPTGLFLSELSIPYYDFKKSNIEVDIASIKGGKIPMEPVPFFIDTPEDKRFKKDTGAMSKLQNSTPIKDIDFTEYDIIFISGGWGGAYDLGFSELLGEKISEAYYSSKAIIGGVCHGVLGLIKAKDKDGNLLIAGRKMTAFKDIFATLTVVDDEKRFVTGQNQNSGHETSYAMMEILNSQ